MVSSSNQRYVYNMICYLDDKWRLKSLLWQLLTLIVQCRENNSYIDFLALSAKSEQILKISSSV